jgi:outer membrane protein OmpA-like peptidoglycan-associated protein
MNAAFFFVEWLHSDRKRRSLMSDTVDTLEDCNVAEACDVIVIIREMFMYWYYEKLQKIYVCFFACIVFLYFGPALLAEEAPIATIVDIKGIVVIYTSEQFYAARVGMMLHAGYGLITQDGAEAIVEFSDGSRLTIAEHADMKFDTLLKDEQTGARVSRLKLWWGKVRSVVAPGHQAPGSEFTVQTPNALAGVKFSEPDSEMQFNPQNWRTQVHAYKFGLELTNLSIGVTATIPEGRTGIVEGDLLLIPEQIVYFSQGGVVLDEGAQKQLEELATIIRDDRTQIFLIEGHADNTGAEEVNRRLSRQRAESVKNLLVQEYGVDPAFIRIQFYGSERPLDSNDTEQGRAKNRRVEVYQLFE